MISPTARAIIYILCIGGLLVLNALVVMVLWNQVLGSVIIAERQLSFLEGAGITAFAYVGVFGMRHALQAVRAERRTTRTIPIHDATSNSDGPASVQRNTETVQSRCSNLTADEKARLRETLRQQCGCTDGRQPRPDQA
jgi:hypothetical protein